MNGADIMFDSGHYILDMETITLTDEKISKDWRGRKKLYRAVFIPKEKKKEYVFDIKIR